MLILTSLNQFENQTNSLNLKFFQNKSKGIFKIVLDPPFLAHPCVLLPNFERTFMKWKKILVIVMIQFVISICRMDLHLKTSGNQFIIPSNKFLNILQGLDTMKIIGH
jgi:hypothetical protein